MEELSVLAKAIGAGLTERGETVAIAESSSGGLISAALLGVPGASKFYIGGAVVYTAKARELTMGLSRADVTGMRSASEPYAQLLATTARSRFGTTWALSETGAAGPTGNGYGDAAGHTCISVSGPVDEVMTLETGKVDRAHNMQVFAQTALQMLLKALDSKTNAKTS